MSIKIRTAENSMDDSELSILDTLNRNDFPRKGLRITLLGYFKLHGPNGKHTCLAEVQVCQPCLTGCLAIEATCTSGCHPWGRSLR